MGQRMARQARYAEMGQLPICSLSRGKWSTNSWSGQHRVMCYPAGYKDGSTSGLASEIGVKWGVWVLCGSRGDAISCILGHHWWPAPGNFG